MGGPPRTDLKSMANFRSEINMLSRGKWINCKRQYIYINILSWFRLHLTRLNNSWSVLHAEWYYEVEIYIHLLDLNRNSCKKCNYIYSSTNVYKFRLDNFHLQDFIGRAFYNVFRNIPNIWIWKIDIFCNFKWHFFVFSFVNKTTTSRCFPSKGMGFCMHIFLV